MSTFDSSSDNVLNNYKVFSQNVGKWEGNVRFLDANLQELKHYKIAQTFAEVVDKWVLTNTYIYPDGTTASQSFDPINLSNNAPSTGSMDRTGQDRELLML